MVIDKMTRELLLKFDVGDQKVFTLPSFKKAKSAASQAYQAKNHDETYGWMFSAIIGDPMDGTRQRSVTITRTA